MVGSERWDDVDPAARRLLGDVWIPVGVPGYAGDAKARWQATLDGRFGADGWRIAHIVRGEIVPRPESIVEVEEETAEFGGLADARMSREESFERNARGVEVIAHHI